ncbi:UNVERIFIED_CONTAM: hypothetical protein FKN15_011490 [Acipenser sinensis]
MVTWTGVLKTMMLMMWMMRGRRLVRTRDPALQGHCQAKRKRNVSNWKAMCLLCRELCSWNEFKLKVSHKLQHNQSSAKSSSSLNGKGLGSLEHNQYPWIDRTYNSWSKRHQSQLESRWHSV